MDLRRHLLGRLALLLAGLLAGAAAIQLLSLRADVEAEVSASARLVDTLIAADAGDPRLGDRLAQAELRHLRLRTPDGLAEGRDGGFLAALLGMDAAVFAEREIRVGGQRLLLAANPASEFDERLADTVRLLITLLLYSAATLGVTWWITDRALRPVREIEAGLRRLADGEADPALPPFALHEFSRVAGAIDRLAAALQQAREAQRALARQLIHVQEEERRGLARDLHDDLGQTLVALNVAAAHLERHAAQLAPAAVAECAGDMRHELRCGRERLRAMLRSLRPHGLDAASLRGNLIELIENWSARETGIEFASALPPVLPEVDEAVGLVAYRVVQEGLTNTVRHSGARRCSVEIRPEGDGLRLDIVDDGAGFPAAGPERRGGLLGMAERVDMVGGRLEAIPEAGGGTRLTARLPLAGKTKTTPKEREDDPHRID